MSRKQLVLLALLACLLLAFVAVRSAVLVDETESALVTDFGRIVAVYDGPDGPGLHLKWPWQSSRTVDRRLQVFDPPAREVITGDKRNLEISSYVAWRVTGPELFVKSVGTPESAEARLSERVSAALSDAIGRRSLATLASTDSTLWGLDALADEVVAAVAPQARNELGIEVIDVRLRRFNHPVEVRPAVFDLIRSERKQAAAALRAQGEAEYQQITSRAERDRDTTLARAEAEAERIRGQADADAARIANEVHARDPKFYEFLRTLDAYRSILDDKSIVVLSSTSPLLKLLTQGPDGELNSGPAPVSASPATAEGKP
jgi:membrane protease subunit HflC